MRIFMWLLIMLGSIAATCAHTPPSEEVDRLWAQKEAEWIHAAKTFDQKGLIGAAAFFEEITGIKSQLEVTYLGVLPTKADESLKAWRSWFRQNRRLLYFDSRTGRLEKAD